MSKDEFLSVGGQAIVEGVMMRSPKYFTVACRAPNKELVVKTEPIEKTWIGRQKWLKIPFLRGSWALLDAMTLGIRAMRYASDIQLAPEYQTEETKAKEAEPTSGEKVMNKRIQEGVITGTIIFSLVFGLFLFKFLPQLVATMISPELKEQAANNAPKAAGGLIQVSKTNLLVETIKFLFFIGYLLAISQLQGIKEVFMYHGAEHKAINVYEKELPLTMDNCRVQTRLHPRCGTSFAIIVLLLGFLIFPFVVRFEAIYPQFRNSNLMMALGNFIIHLAILPFIAGIAYELLRFAGKFRDNKVVMALFVPGLLTQYITTKEPRDDQIEVALESLKACLVQEEAAKATKV
jgi:uncharacterized protein YqhQ